MKNLLIVALLGMYSFVVLAQNNLKEPKRKVLGLFDGMVDKVDFSLKQNSANKHAHFSLGYRLFFYRANTHLTGAVITAQTLFGEKTLFTPKVGYRIVFDNLINVQLDAGLNTNFHRVSYSINPSIGFTFLEMLGIYYEYDFQVEKQQFPDIGKHRIGIFFSPMAVKAFAIK